MEEIPALFRPAMVVRTQIKPHRLIVPDVRCDLIWVDNKLMLSGPLTRARPSFAAGKSIVLASFDALVTRQWLNIPLKQFTDQVFPLSEVAPHLETQLAAQFAKDANAIAIPSQQNHSFKHYPRLSSAVSELRRGGSVSAAAAAACLSDRQIERLFKDELGLSPKLFCRILRLRRAISMAKIGLSLANAAAAAGYADQSHFSRESTALLGRPPGDSLQYVGNMQDILSGRMAD